MNQPMENVYKSVIGEAVTPRTCFAPAKTVKSSRQNAKRKAGIHYMLTLKIKYANGDINLTRMNATVEEAKAYYIGKTFNIGVVSDDLQKCVGIEVLEDNSNQHINNI